MFTPYSLVSASAPSVLGQLQSGTNTAPFSGMTLGAGQAPQPQTQQPPQQQQQQNNQQQLSNTSAAAQNSTNQTTVLTGSQSGQVNSNLASTTTQQTPTLSYVTEANRSLGMPTNSGQVLEQLQQYYAPRGLGYINPNAPSTQQLQTFANNLTSAAGGYQQNASTFGNLYADFAEGRMAEQDYVANLQRMQELSRQAAGQWNDVQGILSNSFLPTQTVPGMGTTQNTLGLAPAQRFILPQETWDMSPGELASWIQSYERKMGRDSFIGNAAWKVGPALIGGAGAIGLTGITSPLSLTNSIIGTGIENLAGINSR
jgi:hypothetical protein